MRTVYFLENMDTASKIHDTPDSQNQLVRIDFICLITKLIYELTPVFLLWAPLSLGKNSHLGGIIHK